MCDYYELETQVPSIAGGAAPPVVEADLAAVASTLVNEPEMRCQLLGFIGYGSTGPGDRVLLAVDTHYDLDVVDAVADALRRRGATVDRIVLDAGPDRDFEETDEIRAIMRREPFWLRPRRYEGVPWIEELTKARGYSLLIHGVGGPTPVSDFRYEGLPCITREHFLSPATVFPREVNSAINRKTQEMVYGSARNGSVRLTDPEGTDLTYSLPEGYYDGRHYGWRPDPVWGHIMAHPATPLLPSGGANGVVAGTTSHYVRAFPQIRLHVEHGRVVRIEGGGAYGAGWRDLLEESRKTQYPCFPGPGLFWLWEVAIGTNPKTARPRTVRRLSSGAFEMERLRSGVIHTGWGTVWRAPEESWAGEQGLLYGHLHVHHLFATLTVTTQRGEEIVVVKDGRLTALDDSGVRAVAGRYGDPDELLGEAWIPSIPGINAPGRYEDYARDPARWIYGDGEATKTLG
jgi:hypothetical protein